MVREGLRKRTMSLVVGTKSGKREKRMRRRKKNKGGVKRMRMREKNKGRENRIKDERKK